MHMNKQQQTCIRMYTYILPTTCPQALLQSSCPRVRTLTQTLGEFIAFTWVWPTFANSTLTTAKMNVDVHHCRKLLRKPMARKYANEASTASRTTRQSHMLVVLPKFHGIDGFNHWSNLIHLEEKHIATMPSCGAVRANCQSRHCIHWCARRNMDIWWYCIASLTIYSNFATISTSVWPLMPYRRASSSHLEARSSSEIWTHCRYNCYTDDRTSHDGQDIPILILPHWVPALDSSGNQTIGINTLGLNLWQQILFVRNFIKIVGDAAPNINAKNVRIMPPVWSLA